MKFLFDEAGIRQASAQTLRVSTLSRRLARVLCAGVIAATGVGIPGAWAAGDASTNVGGFAEAWREIPAPPDFHVEATELDGPVFANADGMTLYTWPQHKHRNGYSGEPPGKVECHDDVLTVTAGLMSPYPPGIELPELDARPSCTDLWPPVVASADAEPVGDWTIITRSDGSRQWAFDEQPLYTSVRDNRAGDVIGGTTRRFGGDSPAYRVPLQPPSQLPPGFAVASTSVGRMLTTNKNASIYAMDADTATSTACDEACLARWQPVIAPALIRPQGEWSILERSPGVRQWVFRGKPLYTHVLDQGSWSQVGSDQPGWQNVFTQKAPSWPQSFTAQATLAGNVLADADGMSIYVYSCGEDSADQLSCDHPDDTQVYRVAMCGGGDPEKCLRYWPYVEAGDDEVSINRSWRIATLDPMTGRFVDADAPGALRVWTYRDRPVYGFGQDERPGDVNGGGTGEWRGQRNGLRAFWIRNDYMRGIL